MRDGNYKLGQRNTNMDLGEPDYTLNANYRPGPNAAVEVMILQIYTILLELIKCITATRLHRVSKYAIQHHIHNPVGRHHQLRTGGEYNNAR